MYVVTLEKKAASTPIFASRSYKACVEKREMLADPLSASITWVSSDIEPIAYCRAMSEVQALRDDDRQPDLNDFLRFVDTADHQSNRCDLFLQGIEAFSTSAVCEANGEITYTLHTPDGGPIYVRIPPGVADGLQP